MFSRPFLFLAGLVTLATSLVAEPLSKKTDVDFFRDVPSRNLKGLASRSDGRLVAGPTFAEIATPPPADLLWCLEPGASPTQFLVGTGPDGRVLEITFNPANATYATRDIAKLDDPQVFTLKRLADGAILAGTSPKGALYLLRDDKPVARVQLPADSIFDLLVLDANTVLVATGNPGRIYKVDLKKFAAAGVTTDKLTDAKLLAERGITTFGEIRDRNARRLAALADGRIALGSAPRGNLYLFPKDGGAPVILQENRDAEVTDLLALPNGDLLATLVFSSTSGESRITPSSSSTKGGGSGSRENAKDDTPPPAQVERFGGRSSLILFPPDGFPEVLASRGSTAFYRMAKHGDLILLAGGEQGELVGYDPKTRLSITFAGSVSSQLNSILPISGAAGKFLVLRNNSPGLGLLDFNAAGPREAETRRVDLGSSAQFGALRFNRLRQLTDANLSVEVRTNNGTDEVEGWSSWTPLKASGDGGWRTEGLRGRYAKFRIKLAGTGADNAALEIDRASLYSLPQNRRPQLQDFRVLTPGYAVLPAVDQPPSPVVSLSQLMSGPKDDDRRRSSFMNSQVVPSPGSQVIIWTINDPDGDNFVSTFSIRRDGDTNWTDVAASTKDSYAQFDTAHLPDGVYFTRLVAREVAPRPERERLTQTFETDDLIIDHAAPEVLEATAVRTADAVKITVRGRDNLTLLDGIEVVFNNGVRETLEQPVDGVRDGREETFMLDVPVARVSNATTVEVTLYDAAGNGTARRLKL